MVPHLAVLEPFLADLERFGSKIFSGIEKRKEKKRKRKTVKPQIWLHQVTHFFKSQIYSADTGRCIRTNDFGFTDRPQKISCPFGTIYVLDLGRCVPTDPNSGTEQPRTQTCPPGQTYCVDTGKCCSQSDSALKTGPASVSKVCKSLAVYGNASYSLCLNNGHCPAGSTCCPGGKCAWFSIWNRISVLVLITLLNNWTFHCIFSNSC